jgi:hypothetical protein
VLAHGLNAHEQSALMNITQNATISFFQVTADYVRWAVFACASKRLYSALARFTL